MSKNDTENSPENEDAEKGKLLGFKDWLVCTRQKFAKSYARLSSEERWRVNALGVLGAAIGLKNISWLGAVIAGAFFWLATISYYILTEDQRRSDAEKSMRFQPYATLGMFIRWFPHVVGTTAFAALFVSPMTSSFHL